MKTKKQKRNQDKMKVIAGFIVSATVILTLVVYMLFAGSLQLSEILVFPVVIVIGLLALFLVIKRAKAYKSGLPFDDELEKKVKWKAGYYTFLVIIYVSLGVAWYADFLEKAGTPMPARYAAYIVILASAVLFFIFYLYLGRKGDF